MGRLGRYDYPDYRVTRALEVTRKLCEPSYKGEISRNNLAELLEMNPRGGGFNVLVASLRDYGLVEGREQLKVTDLGKKIVAGTPEEQESSKAQAFLNVELFKDLYQRTGSLVPEETKFHVLLKEVTGEEDPVKVRARLKDIMPVYSDGIKFLGTIKSPENAGVSSMFAPQQTTPNPQTLQAGQQKFIEIHIGPYFQRLPYTPRGFDMAVAFIQGLKEEETKSA